MRPIRLGALSAARLRELDHAYRTARDGRLRIRALMVPLAATREFFDFYNGHPRRCSRSSGRPSRRTRDAVLSRVL
jgi:hypothetical protein